MENINYKSLYESIDSLTKGIPYPIANLANVSALLFHRLTNVNWAGFYLVEDNQLVLGPFQGNVACIQIPKGKGVCGTAWEKDEIQLVKDVHTFPGHIACDSASNSEIVIPIHKNGEVIGVLDIDSVKLENFEEKDQEGLLEIVQLIENRI